MNPDVIEAQDAIKVIIDAAGASNVPYKRALLASPRLSLYGPYIAAMANQVGELLAADQVDDPVNAARALGINAELYRRANLRYDRKPWPADILETHQYNVMHGKIAVLPREYWTTAAEGIRQVRTANRLLSQEPDGVESWIARNNYGGCFFGKGTMAEATRTLIRGDLGALVARNDHHAMPHLSVGNYVIGKTFASVMAYLEKNKDVTLRAFDIGSGHGATLAAMLDSIMRAGIEVDPSRVAITTIETTPVFYRQGLRFARSDKGASSIGLDLVRAPEGSDDFSQFGSLTALFGDAPAAFKRLDKQNTGGPKEILFIDANFAFHRIPDTKKLQILENVRHAENVIVTATDLMRNTSIINRGFYNSGANGPDNTGCENLRALLEAEGFTIIDLRKEKPRLLDRILNRRIVLDDINPDADMHGWIAVKGKLAHESLGLRRVTTDFVRELALNKVSNQ